MKTNVGSTDKVVRLALAIVLIVLFYKSILSGILGIIALIVAFVLTLTSLIGFCPLYTLLGINTAKKKEQGENTKQLNEKKQPKKWFDKWMYRIWIFLAREIYLSINEKLEENWVKRFFPIT